MVLRRTKPSTNPAGIVSCRPTRPPREAISTNGNSPRKVRSPLSFFSTSFPGTCSGARARTYKTDPVAAACRGPRHRERFRPSGGTGAPPFFYLPFMHSETLRQQEVGDSERSVGAGSIKLARHHRDIVARFGRFPHRNAILGRNRRRTKSLSGGKRLQGLTSHSFRAARHGGDAGAGDLRRGRPRSST